MPPINIKERKKAFLNFLLLFLLSIIMIIVTVYFSSEVPSRQNEDLRKQVNQFETERDFSKKFTKGLLSISTALDTINNKTLYANNLDGTIGGEITKLSAMVEAESTENKALYLKITQVLTSLQATKQDIRKLNGDGTNKNLEATNKILELNGKLSQATAKFIGIQTLLNTFKPQLPPDFVNQVSPLLQP